MNHLFIYLEVPNIHLFLYMCVTFVPKKIKDNRELSKISNLSIETFLPKRCSYSVWIHLF